MTDLNPEQQVVATHLNGPLRVGAVAGSGKTHALIERVAYLVEKKGVHPNAILLITFSANAKNEMKKRVDKRLPGAGAGKCARTFHSIGLSIYREETLNDEIEIDNSGLLWLKTMTLAYKGIGINPEKKALKRFSSLVKNNLIGTNEALRRLGKIDPRMSEIAEQLCRSADVVVTAEQVIEAFYRAEIIRTKTGIEHQGAFRKFLTFDDMIYESAMLLRRQDIRARWGDRWQYVLQDECQDVNLAQDSIAETLCHKHRNYMVVGDPSQSIFQFRGSHPQKFLSFEQEWPGAKTVVMHRNYRSGIEIVRLANDIMDHMPASTVIADDFGPAEMTSERGTRSFVGYHLFNTSQLEAEAVAENIEAHHKQGVTWKEQAVLLRMNRMTRDIELALARRDVPFKMLSGVSFFGLREAKLLFGYLRLILGRASESDLVSALGPVHGLGKAFVKKVADEKTDGETWIDAVRKTRTLAKPYQGRVAADWLLFLEPFLEAERTAESKKRNVGLLLDLIRTKLKLDDHFQREGEDAEDNRATGNLDAVTEFAEDFSDPREMLDLIDDIEAQRQRNARKQDVVKVSTVHKAKGAEWEIVYVIQVADGRFPTVQGDLAEERRIFYVAATRAKDELWLSRPIFETVKGEQRELKDSIFITAVGLKPPDTNVYPIGRAVEPSKVGTQMGLLL